jgi:2-haloacid dehalogenase
MEITERVSTIIFDFGGVLLDWDPRHLYRKLFMDDEPAMERFLAEVDFYAWNLQQDAGRPFDLAVEELCARYPQHCELVRAYDTRWEESISGPIQPTVDLLDSLRDTGYRLAGLSNWSAEKFELVRHRYPFLEWFETIVISGDVGLVKPDRQIFLLLLERLQDPAGQCLLIDDSPGNIDAARQLGLQTIHYRSPDQLKRELTRLGIIPAR